MTYQTCQGPKSDAWIPIYGTSWRILGFVLFFCHPSITPTKFLNYPGGNLPLGWEPMLYSVLVRRVCKCMCETSARHLTPSDTKYSRFSSPTTNTFYLCLYICWYALKSTRRSYKLVRHHLYTLFETGRTEFGCKCCVLSVCLLVL